MVSANSVACSSEGPLDLDFATYEITTASFFDELSGELTDLDGCLVVQDAAGEYLLPIWIEGTVALHPSRPRIVIHDRSYLLGASVTISGGLLAVGFTEPNMGVEIPGACADIEVLGWFVDA